MKSRIGPLLAVLGLCGTGLACQYNVRDIGFVDLNQSLYRLHVFLDQGRAPLRDQIQGLLHDGLDRTNVVGEVVSPEIQGERPDAPEPLPAAVLVSPRGRSLTLPLATPGQTVLETLSDLVTQLARSELRTNLLAKAVEHFAVVLLVESENAVKNRQAALTVETACMQISQQMTFMPKPVKSPPVLVRLSQEDAAQHRVFLWELGVTPKTGPTAAILYGRLRSMGPVFTAEDVTEETLSAYLAVIGADCECDLDRQLLHGPMLAHHWPRPLYETVTASLGFDPEHPQVKMEISQILAAHGTGTAENLQIPDVTFGYQEIVIETVTEDGAMDGSSQRESLGTNDVPEVNVADKEPSIKRVAPLAESITPSGKWPLYSLLAMAAVIIVTGVAIARKRR